MTTTTRPRLNKEGSEKCLGLVKAEITGNLGDSESLSQKLLNPLSPPRFGDQEEEELERM